MAFKNAVKAAKLMQQNFTLNLPTGEGEEFEATFKILTGEEGVWTLRVDPVEEDSASYGFLQDLRTFVASLVSFKEGEEVLTTKDIISVFFSDQELANPSLLISQAKKDSLEQVRILSMWERVQACKTVEEIQALPLLCKEIIWELLLRGFLLTFENDYLMLILAHFNSNLNKIKPNYIVTEFLRATDLLLENKKKAVEDAHDTETQDISGSEEGSPA